MDDRQFTISTIMEPKLANAFGSIHGGEVMKMMDTTAGCTAIRYVRGNVVTARADELQFIKPVHIGDYVTCIGKVVYVGRTSIEIFVTVDIEDLRVPGSSSRALEAYFTMVALDENGRPTPIREYEPITDEEKKLYEHVSVRREFDKARRKKPENDQ